MGDRAFWCSLNISPNVLEDSPIYSSSHPPYHIYICRWPHFLQHRILVLGGHKKVFDSNTSFKIDLYPICVAHSLQAFTKSLVIWHVWKLVKACLSTEKNLFCSWETSNYMMSKRMGSIPFVWNSIISLDICLTVSTYQMMNDNDPLITRIQTHKG